jgi:hypothetical protein
MVTQGDRQNYQWRPNDYSSTTLTRYDQEAEHWVRAIKNVQSNNKPVDFSKTFGFIGLLLGLVINLAIIIVLTLTQLIAWVLRQFNKQTVNQPNYDEDVVTERRLTVEEVAEINRTQKPINLYEADWDNI